MELQKFITYEYECKAKMFVDSQVVENDVTIEHKINESDTSQSFVQIKSESNEKIKLSVDLLHKVYELMREVDPFSFAFDEGE